MSLLLGDLTQVKGDYASTTFFPGAAFNYGTDINPDAACFYGFFPVYPILPNKPNWGRDPWAAFMHAALNADKFHQVIFSDYWEGLLPAAQLSETIHWGDRCARREQVVLCETAFSPPCRACS